MKVWSARTRYILSRLSVGDDHDITNENDSSTVDSGDNESVTTGQDNCPTFEIQSSRGTPANSFVNSLSTTIVDGHCYNDYVTKSAFSQHRASDVVNERYALLNADTMSRLKSSHWIYESILGKIHLDLCKCHESGRFGDKVDEEAAFFHLQQAAALSDLDGLTNIARIYMQLPHDILPHYKVEVI
jgi:hypothetical protein